MIKQKDLVFLLSSSTVVAFIWIGSTLYHTYITSTITEPLSTFIKPIPGQFNTQAINRITNRQDTAPTYEVEGQSSTPPTIPTASAAATPEPSEPVTPTPQPLTETPEETPGDENP